MTDIFLGPKRYVQKPGALDEASRHLAPLGRRPAVLADERVMGIVRPRLESPLLLLKRASFAAVFWISAPGITAAGRKQATAQYRSLKESLNPAMSISTIWAFC